MQYVLLFSKMHAKIRIFLGKYSFGLTLRC